MSTSIRQSSFSSGEVSPVLYGRTDLSKYLSALKMSRNGFVTRHGVWMNRAGTRFVCAAKFHDRPFRLVPFYFAEGQAFMLEFGDQYIRFIYNGAQMAPAGSPDWASDVTYRRDEYVAYSGLVYRSIQADNLNMEPGVETAWWEEATIYELFTPYAHADLAKLKFTQVGDIITITHHGYPPAELRRYANNDWRYSELDLSLPPAAMPAALSESTVIAQPPDSAYIDFDIDKTITGVREQVHYAVSQIFRDDTTRRVYETAARPFYMYACIKDASITAWSSGTTYADGDIVRASDGAIYESLAGSNTNHNPTALGAWWERVYVGGEKFNFLAAQEPIGISLSLTEHKPTIGWPGAAAPAGHTLLGHRLYRGSQTVKGLLYDAVAGADSFQDDGSVEVDFTRSPRTADNPFETDFPAVTTHFEQRRVMANTVLRPADVVASRVGDYYDFGWKPIVVDDDPLSGLTLASGSFEEIRWAHPLRALLLGTSEGLWLLSGSSGVNDALTATSYRARKQIARGCAWLDPVLADSALIMLQEPGSSVREVLYDYSTDSYQSNALSAMAEHLFEKGAITSWTYAQVPFGILWATRADGALLGLTYSREHGVAAWHWHDTAGYWQNVASLLENGEHAVYAAVQRTVKNGEVWEDRWYVERFATRQLARLSDGTVDVARGVFLDSALTYEGPAETSFAGLAHLEGKTVFALANGSVLGPYVVTAGAVDISADRPDGATLITIGLSYTSRMETLDPVGRSGEDLKGRVKRLIKATLEVVDSRGLKVGCTTSDLKEWRQRKVADGYGLPPSFTGQVEVTVPSTGRHGSLAVQQDFPLPVAIASVERELELGDD